MKAMVPKNHPNMVKGRQKRAAALAVDLPPVPEPAAVPEPELTLPAAEPLLEPPPRSGFPVRAVDKRGVDDSVDDRETPPCVYDPLHAEFDFTLDAAASSLNAKCLRYCALDGFWIGKTKLGPQDGLSLEWRNERVWVNPPFSGLSPWVEKAWDDSAEIVCLLLPNNRSEQPFFQKNIEPYRDRAGSILTTRSLPRRRPFLHMGEGIGNRTSKSPPFGLVVVIWDRRRPRRA